ncbi:MAG: UDP-N-acetylmuramoyl-L-alanine--D-glutamate ligase [Streptosporangiales bacterium]|nr:UDP-N-acetylmuramoyl-L-alanine--D-glutamate ligase [Streptosporangiales bacterium]
MDAQVTSDFKGVRVCVAGLGVSGPPAARALLAHGAEVTVVDGGDDEGRRTAAAELERLGARVRLGGGATLPEGTELVVTSPGWRPDAPLLVAAAEAGLPVLGDVELAWRLRPPGQAWLAVTGTNGKTTTVRMLAEMLLADGRRAVAAGNVGTSLVDVVTAEPAYEVVAVELSSFQLHWSSTVVPYAGTVLNVAPDHIDWHGDLEAYAADKGRVYAPGTIAVANADDELSVRLADQAREPAARAAFTLGTPRPGELGVVEDLLVDRAFVDDPERTAEELGTLADVVPYAPHNVANALAAAALARAYGVAPGSVRAGLRAFRPDPHRMTAVATLGEVGYVDDSKATNPHAAAASLAAYDSIVWIAGGLLKGADVDDLVAVAAGRLRAAVLLGADRARIADALHRHAPHVPIIEVPETEPRAAMEAAVHAARAAAHPGDTVLLAPAAASLDMYRNYNVRGDTFTDLVRGLTPKH